MRRLPAEPDQLYLWPDPESWRGRTVATSHQPDLFHAGIWVREFVLEELAARGWKATYFEADGASCRVEAVVPGFSPLRVERRLLAEGRLESLPAPGQGEWSQFLDRLPMPVHHHWLEESNLGRFLAGLRQHAAPNRLARRWQSDWTSDPAFDRLMEPILADPAGFREVFNRVCREERARHGWRSRAHPFPDLREQGSRIELPLWCEGRAVWLDRARRGTLWVGEREVLERSRLRPRAFLWTAFCRLQADLYLHGTGGAAYDQATDLILRQFFRLEPPPYAVAWLNYFLDLPADLRTPIRQAELGARLWQLRHNPQRFLPEHTLAKEKARLLEELSQASRGHKARLTRELKELNRRLSSELEPLAQSLEKQRAEAALGARELAAARFRGYSWLVVDPRRLRAISCRRLSSR